jgi:hypothetical protein
MKRSRACVTAALSWAAILLFSALAPALADQTLLTEVTASGSSPVRIDSCRAELRDRIGAHSLIAAIAQANRNYYLDAAVDFTNISPHPVNAVRFLFDVQDTFGAVTESMGLDWTGTFTPNVAIHARQNLAGTFGAVSQQNTASTPTRVVCHVQFARFEDGRIWKEGDTSAPVAPGLAYPTPYPTQTPHEQ